MGIAYSSTWVIKPCMHTLADNIRTLQLISSSLIQCLLLKQLQTISYQMMSFDSRHNFLLKELFHRHIHWFIKSMHKGLFPEGRCLGYITHMVNVVRN